MMATRNRIEITSADTKQLGFEYQYLYFIVKLLQMRYGDVVGYEALDDIHVISASSGDTVYIQVKHTTDLTAAGTPANLTNLSEDLWKTLSNWSKLIVDPAEQRDTFSAQKAFVEKSKFIFVTNRNTCQNGISSLVASMKTEDFTDDVVRGKIKEIRQSTANETIRGFADDVLALPVAVLTHFLAKVEFVSSDDDLFDVIRKEIRNKMIPEEYVDDVLNSLYTQLKMDFFKKAKRKIHQVITYNEWQSKYQSVFNSVRTTLLPFREYHPLLPDHLDQQPFVKELIEIEAVDADEYGFAELTEFTEHYLAVELQLMDWYEDGKIDLQTVEKFHKNAQSLWRRIHRACHRSTKSDITLDRNNALKCFDQIMCEHLQILSTDLGIDLSNGEFILLANEEKIGWKYKWNA